MEKRYLEGRAHVAGYGPLKVVFDDIKNYQERKSADGEITHFEFDDKDRHYSYTKVGRLYVEDNDSAPELSEFRTVGRRTALKHDLLNNDKRIEVNPNSQIRQEHTYDERHAAEWMERHPNGYYNDDYGLDEDDLEEDEDGEED